MDTSLLDSGMLWIEEQFLPESCSLLAHLLKVLVWDDRIRARKTAGLGVPYNYSGIVYEPTQFPASLLPLLDSLEQRLGYRPNNCLVNYYPDGTSTMGYHSDSTEDLEPGTGIAIVSLGAERTLTFHHKSDKKVLQRYVLQSGSLLYMSPEMQWEWKHGLLPEVGSGPRISLTFRVVKSLASFEGSPS